MKMQKTLKRFKLQGLFDSMNESFLTASNKKGQTTSVVPIMSILFTTGIIFIIVAVALSIGGQVTGNVADSYNIPVTTNYTDLRSIARNSSQGLLNLSSQLPLTGTVVALTVILLLLIVLLYRNFSGGAR